jgi:FlaA1/EpsC-like NDP-sugar epimerase
MALSLVRMAYRMVWEHARARVSGQEGEARRAIVLGAGESARRLVGTIHRRDGWTVLALLDDDPAKQGLRIGGVTVQGQLADLSLPHILAGATHVIVAMPGVPAERREQVLALARHTGLVVMSVPSQMELQAHPATSDGLTAACPRPGGQIQPGRPCRLSGWPSQRRVSGWPRQSPPRR